MSSDQGLRDLVLFLADQVETLVIAARDPHAREIRREMDRLRKAVPPRRVVITCLPVLPGGSDGSDGC